MTNTLTSPQGCLLSPVLFSLLLHDASGYLASQHSTVGKLSPEPCANEFFYADETTVLATIVACAELYMSSIAEAGAICRPCFNGENMDARRGPPLARRTPDGGQAPMWSPGGSARCSRAKRHTEVLAHATRSGDPHHRQLQGRARCCANRASWWGKAQRHHVNKLPCQQTHDVRSCSLHLSPIPIPAQFQHGFGGVCAGLPRQGATKVHMKSTRGCPSRPRKQRAWHQPQPAPHAETGSCCKQGRHIQVHVNQPHTRDKAPQFRDTPAQVFPP